MDRVCSPPGGESGKSPRSQRRRAELSRRPRDSQGRRAPSTPLLRSRHGEIFPRQLSRHLRRLLPSSWLRHGFRRLPAAAPTDHEIAELVLHPGARVNRFEEKAAFTPVTGPLQLGHPDFAPAGRDRKSRRHRPHLARCSLTARSTGLRPPGHWVVLRFGYSLLGITNHPATKEATGLEVDKLNARYVKNYMNGYLDSYKETVGADMMGKRGIRYVITDSWEAGAQNWTDNMIDAVQQAARLRSAPWMPVLTGRIVESAAGQRPVPLGSPQDHRRPHRRRTLRPGASLTERARHGPLRRVARVGPRLHR